MDDMCLAYNINLCRICQVPENLDLIKTDSLTKDGDTYFELLKFIFEDIFWIEDELISLACKTCLEKVTDVAEFKRLCLETNGLRATLAFDPVKVELITIKQEENQAVTEQADDGSEVDTAPQQRAKRKISISDESVVLSSTDSISEEYLTDEENSPKPKRRNKISPLKRPRGRPKKIVKLDKPVRLTTYPCDICPETFKSQDGLNRHVFKHTGIKNFICTICGKKFVANSDLSNHEKLHVKEWKFTCSICPDKKFNAKSNLRTHNIVAHTDPKDYKYLCTECGKTFPFPNWLKEHMLRHDNIRDFACDKCDKSFYTLGKLRRHAQSHSKMRPFKCDFCPSEYKRSDVLAIHKLKFHGIDSNTNKYQIDEKFCKDI